MIRGNFGTQLLWFAYFPVQTFTTFIIGINQDCTRLESLLLIFILSFCVCVIFLTHSLIILGKTLNSDFLHHVFIFFPTPYN